MTLGQRSLIPTESLDFQAGVNVPIFTGGRIKGDITQAEAACTSGKPEAENLRGQIDYDVRTAFLNLNAAKEQVDVAQRNVELANDSLTRSKDRFTSGVTDSVEVVQAEQSLASANDQYITSLIQPQFCQALAGPRPRSGAHELPTVSRRQMMSNHDANQTIGGSEKDVTTVLDRRTGIAKPGHRCKREPSNQPDTLALRSRKKADCRGNCLGGCSCGTVLHSGMPSCTKTQMTPR